MKKLIAELKVGDTVKYSYAHGESLAMVTKVTNCFIEVNGYRFRKIDKDSQKSSKDWSFCTIQTLTEEEIADFRRKEEVDRRRRKLAGCNFNGLTDEVINQIYELVFKEEN